MGEGGVGEVHLAQDRRLGRKVALKFLREEDTLQDGDRERFIFEARAAAAIDHPFICKIYEAGELEGRAFIAMEYIEGETLDAWLSSSPSFEARLQVAREVAEALEQAHAKGFIHRDLKPANIMLTARNHVKVLDFGLAKKIDAVADGTNAAFTVTGTISGTFEYMSPEQAAGDPLDHQSDIFSFGIILHELFTGEHPFRRETPFKSALAILTQSAPAMWEHASGERAAVQRTVQKMLERDLSLRYASMNDVREQLAALTDGPRRPKETEHDSVAVLPFSRISADDEDDYFVDGMTEEIITRLSKVEDLKVISRTSVMGYKNAATDLKKIGRELDVTTIVEGSVRRAANKVRIAARLIEVETDRQLWGEVYDRDLEDIFAVQTEVSHEVANALRQRLSAATRHRMEPVHSEHLEAYNEYLKGRYSLHKLTPDGIRTGIQHFTRALTIDPHYALSHAGLATCHAYAGHLGYVPYDESFPAAIESARQALALDDALSEAYSSLGLVALLYDWDWATAGRHFQRAVDLDPNFATGHLQFSWYFLTMSRNEQALQEAARASELDPHSAFSHVNLGWVQFYSGLYDDSIRQYEKALEIEPDFSFAKAEIAGTYLVTGRIDEAIDILRSAATPVHLAWAYAIAGMREEAEEVLERVTDPASPSQPTPVDLALVHLLLGDLDEGFRHVDIAFEGRDSKLPYLRNHPFMVDVRSDPRMIDVVRRMGLDADSIS